MRCNLASAIFPFAVQLWGRTIIVPQFDQNFDKTVNVVTQSNDADKDKGVPQAFYMHNCMPTPQGYQAISYDTAIPALALAIDFDLAFPVIVPEQTRFLFSPAVGKNYIYNDAVGVWESKSPIIPGPGTISDVTLVTSAIVQSQTYFYYANYKCLVYDNVADVMVDTPLAGLVAADVIGITESNGYMIAWDHLNVAWSSATDPEDFVPSLITGAGGGAVAEAHGRILFCVPISGGFIVYCERNAVAAKYSGNIRFPFIFKEINGSGGVISPEQVSWTANLAEHYAWTTQGFQKLDLNAATFVTPEITDFLGNLFYEDFDEATLTLTTTYLSRQLAIKVTVISDRYIVVSYGTAAPDYTYALVHDIALRRWGKLKITHRDCFQFNNPSLNGAVTYGELRDTTYGDLSGITYGDLLNLNPPDQDVAKKTIAFLQEDGTVKIVNFDQAQIGANGVLMVGKFQFRRNNFIVHQRMDIENLKDGGDFDYYVLPTLDGKTFLDPVEGYLARTSDYSKRYNKRVTGQNVSGLFVGNFNLTSLLFLFTEGGKR